MSSSGIRGYYEGEYPEIWWGVVAIGDRVTTKGRSGWGQPPITGKLIKIERDRGLIRVNKNKERWRTLNSMHKV